MAANISPTSPWVETYDDKDNKWLAARIEHLERKERTTTGSVTRRRDLFALRKLLTGRQKEALEKEGASGQLAAPVSVPVSLPTS